MSFVKTKHGLMRQDQAKALAKFERDQESARVDAAKERLKQTAAAYGVDGALIERLWGSGMDLFHRRLATIKKIVARPRAELERQYACTKCRILYDDDYKAKVTAKRLVACYTKAMLKGCRFLIPRLTLVGHAPAPKPLPMAPPTPPPTPAA